MSLEPGSPLGPYLIQSPIGMGGMGVVYRARDPKLDRLVAIKVVSGALGEDPVRLARFEREARAVAALSHPNVLGIFDFGREGTTLYAVMELLEGENLRERLRSGALPVRRALEIATQVALGLAAAHGRGILHRDIKPENIFLCRDGQVKVLDFGLAKPLPNVSPAPFPSGEEPTACHAIPVDPAPAQPDSPGAGEGETRAGLVAGTLGYMSPEQVRGEELDARSDIFSFGLVLFEMLTGQRAFRRDSAALTFEAILNQEPPDLRSDRGPLPPALESLVAHCLEKRPEARFHSMGDLAFALQHLDTLTLASDLVPYRPRRKLLPWLLGLGAALALGAAFLRPSAPAAVPDFHRVNLSPGTLESAFFGPDGRTIYYSMRIQGGSPEIFVLHPDSDGPRPLGIQDALLLGVSASSELALLRHPSPRFGGRYSGLLAQAPGGGGSAKEILEDVCDAAWDGRSMALLATDDKGMLRVEFPSGHTVLEENGAASGIKCLRLAPGGNRLAMIHSDSSSGTSLIGVIERDGGQKVLFEKRGDSLAHTLTGLAWGPKGELWFSEMEGDQTTLWALGTRGRRRLVWRGEGAQQLLDIAPNGRVLMASQRARRAVFVQRGDTTREISIQEGTQGAGLSADGRTLLLLESPSLDGGTAQDQAFLLNLDQGPPVKLARGNPVTLSPDGRSLQLSVDFLGASDLDGGATAAFHMAGLDPRIILDPRGEGSAFFYFMPTGPGRPRVLLLPKDRFISHGTAYLQGQDVIFQGQETNKAPAWFRWTPGAGDPVAFTPEGLGASVAGLCPLSPDGSRFIVTGNGREWFIVPLRGGARPQAVPGLHKGERVVGWSADGRAVFVRPELTALPVAICRVTLATGARTPVRSFTPPDPAGHLQVRSVFMTPDARTFAFTWDRKLSELFQVDGLVP